MHVYYAVTGNDTARAGALLELCAWAVAHVTSRKAKIVKILKARPNERHARIVLEITQDGTTIIRHGRTLALGTLKKAKRVSDGL